MQNYKINILYAPKIDDEEKKIFEEVFGKDEVIFGEYKTKGMIGGMSDIQIIIDTLNDPTIIALLAGTEFVRLIAILVKKLFNRNNKKIEDNKSRPRYTNFVIRLEKKFVIISNTNNEAKLTISETSASNPKFKNEEYSDEKLRNYLENN